MLLFNISIKLVFYGFILRLKIMTVVRILKILYVFAGISNRLEHFSK